MGDGLGAPPAITRTEAEYAFRSETAEGRARLFGRAETVWRLADELAYMDRVRSVTSDQVRLVARRYLDPERYGGLRPSRRPDETDRLIARIRPLRSAS